MVDLPSDQHDTSRAASRPAVQVCVWWYVMDPPSDQHDTSRAASRPALQAKLRLVEGGVETASLIRQEALQVEHLIEHLWACGHVCMCMGMGLASSW